MTRIALIGNATWLNRGCEAIELATRDLLTDVFDPVEFTVIPFSQGDPRERDADDGVRRLAPPEFDLPTFALDWWRWRWHRKMSTGREYRALASAFDATSAAIGDCDCVLSVGGDNYTADYGRPNRFWALNEHFMRRLTPVYLWGASVGPFEAGSLDERIASERLAAVTGIFARESVTEEYLSSIGVRSGVRVNADPAFALAPREPTVLDRPLIPDGVVGVNVGPLFGRYTGRGEESWFREACEMVTAVARVTGRPLLLVPHVLLPGQDDHAFLSCVAEAVQLDVEVSVVEPSLGARELKWVISRCNAFVGARTHSTIAAISSGVPTISLGYSAKAVGINRDVFGHDRYVVSARDFDAEKIACMVQTVLGDPSARQFLTSRVPELVASAKNAGVQLRADLSLRGGD